MCAAFFSIGRGGRFFVFGTELEMAKRLVTFWMDERERVRLSALAGRRKCSRSALLRALLAGAVERELHVPPLRLVKNAHRDQQHA